MPSAFHTTHGHTCTNMIFCIFKRRGTNKSLPHIKGTMLKVKHQSEGKKNPQLEFNSFILT